MVLECVDVSPRKGRCVNNGVRVHALGRTVRVAHILHLVIVVVTSDLSKRAGVRPDIARLVPH
jgi:hypothetical protein